MVPVFVGARALLQRFAEVASTNAACILGLYPRKGVIAAGGDAGIVLIDPTARGRDERSRDGR